MDGAWGTGLIQVTTRFMAHEAGAKIVLELPDPIPQYDRTPCGPWALNTRISAMGLLS